MENNQKIVPRGERYNTHTYVTLQKNKIFNIKKISGVLLDVSSAGFKIELVANKMPIKNATNYWLKLPLHQLGVLSPQALFVQVHSVWVDHERHLFGGLFLDTTIEQKELIESVIGLLVKKLAKASN